MRALRIEEVHLREFRAERIAEGRIAYNEDRSTPVFSPYSGRVVRALARLGDEIRAGEPLLEIETTDLAGAANDLLSALDAGNKARSTLEQALREERRQNSLFSARAASQRDVEQARVAAANAAADLRSAEATLAAARDKLRVLGRTPGADPPHRGDAAGGRGGAGGGADRRHGGAAPRRPGPVALRRAAPSRSSPSPTCPPCGWWPRCGSWTRR